MSVPGITRRALLPSFAPDAGKTRSTEKLRFRGAST